MNSGGHVLEQVGSQSPSTDGHTLLLPLVPGAVRITEFDAFAADGGGGKKEEN